MKQRKSAIAETIKTNGLVPGVSMKTVSGNLIPCSVVLDAWTWATYDPDDRRVRIFRERPLHGDEIEMDLSREAFAILQQSPFAE